MKKAFEQGQRLGVDVLPRHFYSEIPNIHELRTTTAWRRPFTMIGVPGAEVAPQLAFVEGCCSSTVTEQLKAAPMYEQAASHNGEEGYGPTEADFLYAYVYTHQPAQIFQIGCGASTAICQLAAAAAGYTPEIICVEPFPTPFLSQEAEAGRITLIHEKAQELDYAVIEGLREDVFFFVDSTHTLGPSGEVSRIILEMLPRLKKGAHVHFHDINFPYDYHRKILEDRLFFWHESVLLHAFLTYNSRFKVLASLSMLHYEARDDLKRLLPNYRPALDDQGLNMSDGHFPNAIYLEVVA
ncbi:MAG: class I SAM-dependent methyltransferase [Bacteroidota bacterium]